MGNAIILEFYRFVFIALFCHFATPLECPPGKFLYSVVHDGLEFCIDCRDGTFLSYKDHRQTACLPCEEIIDSSVEILISPCSRTHDAVIHCVDGYYRQRASNPGERGQCRKCTECRRSTGQQCDSYRDTVCCFDVNFEVVAGVCRERPWFCRRGQYFNPRSFFCETCPKNTFMPLDYHVQPECWKCRDYFKYESYRPLDSVIIQECNSTHAPAIRCKNGYFMNPNMGYRGNAIGCSPCTDCSTTDSQYEGRKCDSMEDTVCCPQENMTVVDTSQGPVCKVSSMSMDSAEDQCCQCDVRRETSTSCSLCANSTAVNDSNSFGKVLVSSVVDHGIPQDTSMSAINQISDCGFQSGVLYIFIGILIGLPVAPVFYLVYRKFRRPPLRSVRDVQIEMEDLAETDPLHSTTRNTPSSLRHRQTAIRRGTKHPQSNFGGPRIHLTKNDDHGREQCYGDESDLHFKKKLCRNQTDHTKFFSVMELAMDFFPKEYRGAGRIDYIKAVSDLTVRLKVNHTSRHRPKDYPCSELGGAIGAGIKRFGTGLVFQVSKKFTETSELTCPCRYCSVYHDEAMTDWAEFAVVTSAHIVYDNNECSRTSCRLWFNHDDNFVQAPSLKGIYVKEFDENQDFRILYCVTHDGEVSQKLERKVARFNELREKYKHTVENDIETKSLAVLISQQHGLSKKISLGKATLKMNGEIQTWSYNVQTCPGSCGASVCILDKRQGSRILTTIHSIGNESTAFYI